MGSVIVGTISSSGGNLGYLGHLSPTSVLFFSSSLMAGAILMLQKQQ
jgi:hypothetical protein